MSEEILQHGFVFRAYAAQRDQRTVERRTGAFEIFGGHRSPFSELGGASIGSPNRSLHPWLRAFANRNRAGGTAFPLLCGGFQTVDSNSAGSIVVMGVTAYGAIEPSRLTSPSAYCCP